MKKFLIVLLIVFTVSIVNAATLMWDASTGAVKGYTVYYALLENQNDPEEAWNTKTITEGTEIAEIKIVCLKY